MERKSNAAKHEKARAPLSAKKRRTASKTDQDLSQIQIYSEMLGEYLKKNRDPEKTKAQIAQELGVGMMTYYQYESGKFGPRGVQLEFLERVATRDGMTPAELLMLLGNEQIPEAAKSSPVKTEWAKWFRTIPEEDLKDFMDSLKRITPKPSRFIPDRGSWLLSILKKIVELPYEEMLHFEQQLCRHALTRNKKDEATNERLNIIYSELMDLLKERRVL